jgi:hypothetical protein
MRREAWNTSVSRRKRETSRDAISRTRWALFLSSVLAIVLPIGVLSARPRAQANVRKGSRGVLQPGTKRLIGSTRYPPARGNSKVQQKQPDEPADDGAVPGSGPARVMMRRYGVADAAEAGLPGKPTVVGRAPRGKWDLSRGKVIFGLGTRRPATGKLMLARRLPRILAAARTGRAVRY